MLLILCNNTCSVLFAFREPVFHYTFLILCSCNEVYQTTPVTSERLSNHYLMTNSFSNECLGSYNDEERSEMRYVMRIARSASHQNFERSLHFLVECVCWSVCVTPTLFLASMRGQDVVRLTGFLSRWNA